MEIITSILLIIFLMIGVLFNLALVGLLFYAVVQVFIEMSEDFGIVGENDVEGFCAGPNCSRHHGRYSHAHNYNYYDSVYPYYGYRSYYDQYWYNPWGYLPCMNSIFGGSYCW